MPNTLTFYLIFLSQIWLISYFYPNMIAKRVNYVLNNFPPENHPKLYVWSAEKIIKTQKQFLWVNYAIALVGIFLLFNYAVFSPQYHQQGDYYDNIPLMYGILQYIPLFTIECMSQRLLKQMRKADTRVSRSAELVPRQLNQYISPVIVLLAVILFIVTFAVDFYIHEFTFTEDFAIKLFSLTLANGVFTTIVYKQIYGKKLDPYQAKSDRFKQAKLAVNSAVAVSIFVSLFIIAQTVVNAFDYGYIEIIINSLYFQIIAIFSIGAVMQRIKVKDIDFSVYRTDNSQHKA